MQIENRRAVITICLDSPVDKGGGVDFRPWKKDRGKRNKDDDDNDVFYRESRFGVYLSFSPFFFGLLFVVCLYVNQIPMQV